MVTIRAIDGRPRFVAIELTNFLSYKKTRVDLGDFVALIGLNSSGKSNLVKAVRLLRSIPLGLPSALSRLGGFDQLRHRSAGRPYDPALAVYFQFPGQAVSHYELSLGAVKGKRFEVKREHAEVFYEGQCSYFDSDGRTVRWKNNSNQDEEFVTPVPPGQSAVSAASYPGFLLYDILQSLQTVEVNPALIRDFQEPSSVQVFEPDGSNVVSIYESLSSQRRSALTEQLAAVVPGIIRIDVQTLADRQTLTFAQATSSGTREFTARQMSDGTLRAFGILLAAAQNERPALIVIEEPEMAIHLGAMRTLVEILRSYEQELQILITTHSADIIDALPIEYIRVVTSDGSTSQLSGVAKHSVDILRNGLVTPGELLRLNALDPE